MIRMRPSTHGLAMRAMAMRPRTSMRGCRESEDGQWHLGAAPPMGIGGGVGGGGATGRWPRTSTSRGTRTTRTSIPHATYAHRSALREGLHCASLTTHNLPGESWVGDDAGGGAARPGVRLGPFPR